MTSGQYWQGRKGKGKEGSSCSICRPCLNQGGMQFVSMPFNQAKEVAPFAAVFAQLSSTPKADLHEESLLQSSHRSSAALTGKPRINTLSCFLSNRQVKPSQGSYVRTGHCMGPVIRVLDWTTYMIRSAWGTKALTLDMLFPRKGATSRLAKPSSTQSPNVTAFWVVRSIRPTHTNW